MKIIEITASDKQDVVVYMGDDAVIHLDEIIKETEDGVVYKYTGVLVDTATQYIEEALISQAKKLVQAQKLDTIIVETNNGFVFDGNEVSRNNMMSAIQASDILGVSETQWKLADNTIATVDMQVMKEALALSIQAVGVIVLGS